MKHFPRRTWLLRWLHQELRLAGMDREDYKRRCGVISMDEWSNQELGSRIKHVQWIRKQPWGTRHALGAMH